MVNIFGTDLIGMLFNYASLNITGNDGTTAFLLVCFLYVIFSLFKVPLDLVSLFLLPLVITLAIYMSSMAVFLGGFLIIASVLIARKFIAN